MKEIDQYLLREYEKAKLEPQYADFYGFKVLIPCSYVMESPKYFEDRFVDDFLDLHDASVNDVCKQYEQKGWEPEFVFIGDSEAVVPLALAKEELSERAKTLLMLQDCYDRYKKSAVLTNVTNKLLGDDFYVRVGKSDLKDLWEVYEKNRKPLNTKEEAEQKLIKLGHKKIDFEKIFANVAVSTGIVLAMSWAMKDKDIAQPKADGGNFSKNQIEFIETGNADLLVEDYVPEKTYEIKPVEKKAEVKKVETKKAEVEKRKAPELKPLEAKKPVITIAKPKLDISIMVGNLLQEEGGYGTNAKAIKDAKLKEAKLRKAGKTVDKETYKTARARVIDQETNFGVTATTYKDFRKKYKELAKNLPKKLVNISKKDAELVIKTEFVDKYKINKIDNPEMANLLLDITYNHSTKSRKNVVDKGIEKVADKYDLEMPDTWNKKIEFLNECNEKQLKEAGLEMIEARKNIVKGHQFEDGLFNRYERLEKSIKNIGNTDTTSVRGVVKERG